MTFDKVKTLRTAERYLELGKIRAAIKEYCKIVESEPDDLTTLNMLGDLYVRVGNPGVAISYFHRIAEHYRDQDFGLKPIAMYKKIDRLKPRDIEIARNLAELYAKQDLVVEARAYYLLVAEAHSRSGATKEGLDVLGKIADLDPQNTSIRIKLAEGYLKEGMNAEAAACFAAAGEHLLARGAFDDALQSFNRVLETDPSDRTCLKGLLAAHSARGTADEAAEVIERAAANDPDDVELLSMLASAQLENEDAARAEQAISALVAKESSAYLRFVEVARLYLKADKVEDAVRVVGGIAEQMLAEREENQLFELVNELLACDSDNVQALRLLVRAYWWQRDTENLKAALERLAESAQAAGLAQDERYALTQLTRLAPDQTHHVGRLKQLGGAEEKAAAEDMPEIETVTQPVLDEPAPVVEERVEFEPQTLSTPTADAEFDWNSMPDMAEPWTVQSREMEIERGFTFQTVVAEELPAPSPAEIAASASGGPTAAVETVDQDRKDDLRRQELDSVDFYIAQGYLYIPVYTLHSFQPQFGAHLHLERRRQQLLNPDESATPPTNVAEVTLDDHGEVQFVIEFEMRTRPVPTVEKIVAPPTQINSTVS